MAQIQSINIRQVSSHSHIGDTNQQVKQELNNIIKGNPNNPNDHGIDGRIIAAQNAHAGDGPEFAAEANEFQNELNEVKGELSSKQLKSSNIQGLLNELQSKINDLKSIAGKIPPASSNFSGLSPSLLGKQII